MDQELQHASCGSVDVGVAKKLNVIYTNGMEI
jgi:hypothetical protein